MTISSASNSSDERSPLLSKTTHYHDSVLVDALPVSLPAEIVLPQQEGVNQGLGMVKLNFRLFVSLLCDSVPGKFLSQ